MARSTPRPRARPRPRPDAPSRPTRAERREALVAAALAVVRRDGHAASMDAMAREAGITKPILYRYFGDREGLLTAVADRFADDVLARLEPALAETAGDPQAQVEAAIAAYLTFVEHDPALYTFLTRHAEVGSPAVTGVIDRVAAAVARAVDEGLRQAGADAGPAEWWAYGIVGMVHLAGARWVAHPTVSRDRLVAHLSALAWQGLSGAVEPEPGPAGRSK